MCVWVLLLVGFCSFFSIDADDDLWGSSGPFSGVVDVARLGRKVLDEDASGGRRLGAVGRVLFLESGAVAIYEDDDGAIDGARQDGLRAGAGRAGLTVPVRAARRLRPDGRRLRRPQQHQQGLRWPRSRPQFAQELLRQYRPLFFFVFFFFFFFALIGKTAAALPSLD